MVNTEKLTEILNPLLEKNNVKLYEVVWVANEHNLQISIMKEDGTMDLDTCALISEQISELFDETDPIPGEYTLEVCSPGAEREIKDLSEIDHMTGSYVFVRLKEAIKGLTEVTGEITKVSDEFITLSYRDKAAKRTLEFARENIDFIRMAVKI